MIGNPLALLGLLVIAVPIVIHLLGRHQSRIERFPTLRFIGTSRLNPTKRRRISDWPLLLARIAIVAMAALALSQPLLHDAATTGEGAVSRVVIVDTSASMFRLTPVGPVPLLARQAADSLTAGIAAARVETGMPAEAIAGAVAWLESRPGAREIAIVSDFQRSSLDSADLSAIPEAIGLSLHVVLSETKDLPSPILIPRSTRNDIAVFGDSSDAAWRAIGKVRPRDTTGRISLIYRNAPQAAAFAAANRVDSSWMAQLVVALQRDPALRAAAIASTPTQGAGPDTVLANAAGRPVILAGRTGSRLGLLLLDDPGSLASAALSQALVRAVEPPEPGSERDPSAWTAAELARWQRPATPVTGTSSDSSDARWFWLACLALIGVETWLRSRTRSAAGVVELPAPEERAA